MSTARIEAFALMLIFQVSVRLDYARKRKEAKISSNEKSTLNTSSRDLIGHKERNESSSFATLQFLESDFLSRSFDL